MARLLVSVRDAVEAEAALAGGASVIDVKEPRLGSLGRAGVDAWESVGRVVPEGCPLSVALGEVSDPLLGTLRVEPELWQRLDFVKLGLAGSSRLDWQARWADLAARLGPGPSWVGVVYLDAETADAPAAADVLDAAHRLGCAGLLFDTWDKSCGAAAWDEPASASPARWRSAFEAASAAGLFVAVAGGLDEPTIRRLGSDRRNVPDLFAVRGAVCAGADRTGPIERERVSRLARVVAEL